MMACCGRKFVKVTKFLLAGVTIFCVSWIVSVNEWHSEVHWGDVVSSRASGVSTMRTIVAYSEGKQAELDRPSPVTCDRLPSFPIIKSVNRTWSPGSVDESQWQRVAGRRVSLYAAYYDERTPQHYVRILATFHGRNFSLKEPLYCQTRPLSPYENTIEVVAAKLFEIWWHEWDPSSKEVETPLLLSCPLTEPLTGAYVVSIVNQPCDDPTNAFTMYPSRTPYNYKRTFTICVKDMNFDKDISRELVEWIEINKILGVDLIDVYVDRIDRTSEKVLEYYRKRDFVRIFKAPIKHRADASLWQRRRDHIITYNDCLYRNIGESEYIVPLDIDEVIVPKIALTWAELLTRLKRYGWNSSERMGILIQNVFFFDFIQNINRYRKNKFHTNKSKVYVKRDDVRIAYKRNLDQNDVDVDDSRHILDNEVVGADELYKKYLARCGSVLPEPKLVRNIMRSTMVSPVGHYSKSMMVTKKVLAAFNHYPLASLSAGTSGFIGWPAPLKEVQLNHYKESCNTTVMEECALYGRRAQLDITALRLRARLHAALASTFCLTINNS